MTITSPAVQANRSDVKADNWSHTYFDQQGRRHRAAIRVPVDENGEICCKAFQCPRCKELLWKPLTYKATPVCKIHQRKMVPYQIRRGSMLPYRALWDVCEKPLRPVWALPGMAAAGHVIDAGNVPVLAVAGAVPLAFEVTRQVWRRKSLRTAVRRGRIKPQDPTRDRKLRAAIDDAARKAGYAAAGGTAWLAAVAALGMDPSTVAGRIALTMALLPWAPVAATYLHKLRESRKPAVRADATPIPVDDTPAPAAVNPEMEQALHVWKTVLAPRAGEVIGRDPAGQPIKATVAGKLPGTRLEDWHPVHGGWAATIVGPAGTYEADEYASKVGKIASAFSVKKSMVTIVPDADDENRALVMLQKDSPITESRRWEGPASIDVVKGQAPILTYADGSKAYYEIYRPGWGAPHVAVFGTTGSAKSEFLNLLFAIDRWAQWKGRGLVADFLIDPQQGQSFCDFVDDLAAPPACTLQEAMILVEALRQEGLRRNKYLKRKPWTDEHGRPRMGQQWWNPLEDGPILALTIDEAHDYLSHRPFATAVTKAGRMWRKCGMQLRIATHTPLLTDLGGNMALRDVLTGCSVWMGRTANSLSGPTAFNGRMPVDPRSIPQLPGMAYWMSGIAPKPMLARSDWEGDPVTGRSSWYDWVRDADNNPIGYPTVLPPETLTAFGDEYAQWVRFAQGETDTLDTPGGTAAPVPATPTHAVLAALWAHNPQPADMQQIIGTLQRNDVTVNILDVRQALAELRRDDLVQTVDGLHSLTDEGREAMAEVAAS
jgi:hypothetical protein